MQSAVLLRGGERVRLGDTELEISADESPRKGGRRRRPPMAVVGAALALLLVAAAAVVYAMDARQNADERDQRLASLEREMREREERAERRRRRAEQQHAAELANLRRQDAAEDAAASEAERARQLAAERDAEAREMRAFVDDTLVPELNSVWASVLGDQWSPAPDKWGPYHPGRKEGPNCGEYPALPRNASYCPRQDERDGGFISWDEPGFLLPAYHEAGRIGPAVILAHEWGHAVQDRLGLLTFGSPFTRDIEIGADCFAGAFVAYEHSRQLFNREDLDAALTTVFNMQDPDGVPWTEPGAHGTATDRLDAFLDGRDAEDLNVCVTLSTGEEPSP